MSSAVILLTVLIGIAEMCGNVHQTGGTISSPSSPQLYDPTVVFQTKTAAKTDDFTTIAGNASDENKRLLENAAHGLADGTDGKQVLKYTLKQVTCDAAIAFGKEVNSKNDFITEGTVNCNGKDYPV